MKITIKSSTIVKPAADTPKYILWNSNIDLVIPRIHIPTVYFYKAEGDGGKVFECGHLKESLARALVPFYPMAGRLKDKGKGRIDIDCNGEGVLFVEAVADGCISEYGEYFAPCMKMRQLIPQVDYTKGHSTFPLVVFQVTFFECGGVSIGVGVHHHVADGLGALRFLNYWADVARGVEEDVNLFIDRTLLRARDPPRPKFKHVEYQLPPPLLKVKDADNGKDDGNSGKADSDYIKGNGDFIRVNGTYSKVDDVNGDYCRVNGVHLKGNGDYIEVNGDCIKEIEGNVKAIGSYSTGEGEHGNASKVLHLVNGDFRKVNGDYRKVSGDYHKLLPDTNGVDIEKDDPLSQKLRKEETCEKHQRSLEAIAKTHEDKYTEDYGPISAQLFLFSQEQINSLKKHAAEHALPGDRPFTSYEVLSAHVWRCACLARGLQNSQLTKLYIATDGRSRLQPPLPPDYFGNVIFTATPVEQVSRLVDAPLADAARHIRQTVQVMDDEYLRSAVDYLELQPDLAEFSRGAHTFQTPNLGITSWVRLPIYGADFGWGPPLSMAPAGVPFEGLAYLLPGPPGDSCLRLSITLVPDHMLRFQELIYQF